LYDGADAVGGADLILELLVLFVVVLEEDPDWYVVAPPVYPPSILVLDPLTFVCVSALCTLLVTPINIITNAKSKLILFISTHISHRHKRHIHLHEDLLNNGICDYILYRS
jgi:hypothetical protein